MKKLLLLFTLSCITLLACKKDDDGTTTNDDQPPAPQTRMDTMTRAGGWVITSLTVDPPYNYNGFNISNVYGFLQSCIKDNILMFKADGVLIGDEGAAKCDQADPQQATAAWAFTNTQQTEFDLYGSNDVFAFSLSDTTHFTVTELGLTTMTTINVETVDTTEYTFTTKYKGN